MQMSVPTTGTHGIPGVLNGRGVSGAVFLRMRTPVHTIAKASSVPMLTSSPSTVIGKSPDAIATTMPVMAVVTCGVRNRGCSRANNGGNKPSLLIE